MNFTKKKNTKIKSLQKLNSRVCPTSHGLTNSNLTSTGNANLNPLSTMWLTTTLNKTHKPSSHTHTNSIPELHKHKYNLSHTQTNWNYFSKKLTSCPLLIWEDPWAKPIKPFATMFVYNAPTICLDRCQIFNYLFNKELLSDTKKI